MRSRASPEVLRQADGREIAIGEARARVGASCRERGLGFRVLVMQSALPHGDATLCGFGSGDVNAT